MGVSEFNESGFLRAAVVPSSASLGWRDPGLDLYRHPPRELTTVKLS